MFCEWKISYRRLRLPGFSLSSTMRVATLTIALALAGASRLFAQFSFSQAELKTLPRPCQAHQLIHNEIHVPVTTEAERQYFYSILGDSFAHYHHYCWGLLLVRRGNSTDDHKASRELYNAAVRNFDYVLQRAKPTFVLLPEIYLQKD
jgi:hypothetical protein